MRRIPSLLVVAAVSILGAVGVTHAAVDGHIAAKHRKVVKHKKVHGLGAPGLLTPGNGARVPQMPALTWSAVSGAIEYEYQVAADPRFHSLLVVSAGIGKGTPATHNLAATLEKPVTDGDYYWRVRGLSASKRPGPWSASRKIVKAWTEAPQLLGPAEGAQITWPSVPLVLRWSEVPYAYEYLVTIATDEQLANVVVGTTASPTKTEATVFALGSTLQAGQTYYWQITPIDDIGHRGTPSKVGKFSWSWPTSTSTEVADLNPDPRVYEPEFKWAPVPGAARYEVEVNSARDFPAGSKWCCGEPVLGTAFVPTQVLANNEYYWRVRAIDANGNAGVWNEGPSFGKAFDNGTPTIEHLTMSDPSGNPLPADPTTDTPIATWSPVPGASSYEVQVTRYVEGSGCNWAATLGKQTTQTSSLAWTPVGADTKHIGPTAWPVPFTGLQLAEADTPYCLRVLARSDHDAQNNQVISNWTQIGGTNQPAFTFASQPSPSGSVQETQAGDYLLPQTGTTTARTPLFTWQRVPGASSYYVVIARDAGFTHVVDVTSTVVPAYAPQLTPAAPEEPLSDETTAYYWAVIPVNTKGEVFSEPPLQDAPQAFNKSSVPPTQTAPINGVEVADQPTFRWTPAEGALNYTLQVATNPTFSNPIDNVRTDSTAFTSSSTYPAHETLYWRVRANDTNPHTEGLNWSAVQTFKRTLPVPAPLASNPTSGEAIPVLEFTSVPGATAYNVHVEQPDGTSKDFKSTTASFTASKWEGPGIWRFSARAEFPTGNFVSVPGSYYSPQPFAHTVAPAKGASGIKAGSRIVIAWQPQAYAKQYEVAMSTSETFATTIESHKVSQTNWAPNVDLTKAANKGTLYWRVAAVDQRGNVGPYATGSFVPPRPRCVVKKVKRKRKIVKVCVAVKHAKKKPAKTKHH
jgi:hypothetical protein